MLAKVLVPHLLPWFSYRRVPIAVALGWAVSTFVIHVSPPNVTPLLRIFGVTLSSSTAAVGEVLWLGRLRHYGKQGLAGWGIGTGVGGVVCAVLPYVLTVRMGQFVRYGLGYAWYLVPTILVSHYLILPSPSLANERDGRSSLEGDIELDGETRGRLLERIPSKPRAPLEYAQANWGLAKRLMRPFVLPLALAFAAQSAVFPGFSRAMPVSHEFGSYAAFVAAYGLALQLGNLVARASIVVAKPPRARATLPVLAVGVICLHVLASGASSPALAGSALVFGLVFLAGLAAGGTYMGTFAAAMEDKGFESRGQHEFGLGFIGVGESAGLILGAMAGAALEVVMCGMPLEDGERWCDTTR